MAPDRRLEKASDRKKKKLKRKEREIMKKSNLKKITAVLTAAVLGSALGIPSYAEETGETKKALFAYDQAYYPYDYTTEDGGHDGYEIAVLKAVDELLEDWEFDYVGTTNDDLLLGVESGNYTGGVKGIWWTADREETYLFPQHYIGASITGITFRTEQAEEITDFESFAKVSGKLAPLSPNNAQYTIVENYNKNHPDNQVELIASESWTSAEAYTWVLEGRYDALFDIRTNYEANIVAEDGEYHDYADQLTYVPYEAIPIWVLFNRDQQELADAFDEAFEQLEADGVIDELQQEYFGYSLFELVPEGYQKGDEL